MEQHGLKGGHVLKHKGMEGRTGVLFSVSGCWSQVVTDFKLKYIVYIQVSKVKE